MERKLTKKIMVGSVPVGGGAPVSIQSMLNMRTTDVDGCLAQIRALAAAGCEIARLAVPDMEAAEAFGAICAASPLPLVADIHFDYRLAIRAAENGAAKIRINPGNIGGEDRVRAVVEACGARSIPIRIGVNGGSLEPRLLEKYGHPTPEALVESAFGHIALLEKYDFHDICVSMKSSSVPLMIEAYRLFSERSDYPLHVGVTETGTERMGTIKSAMGIGALLCQGIGDTMRVSLTADPVQEVLTAKDILKAAGLRRDGVNIIACPTCGRTQIDLIPLAQAVDWCISFPHNEQLKFFMTADRFMFLRGEFKDYDRYYAQLDACLPEGLAAAEKAADEFGRSFAKAHMNDKLHYFVGAGTLYGATYSYAMCYWEEMHWIRTKSIHAAEFFHGMLEIVDRDTPVTVFVGEDSQRELALRVAHFLPKVCDNFCVIDTADYPLEGIDLEYRGNLSHLLMHAVTNRIDAHLEALSGHDMKLRRYYRQMEY